MPRTLLLKETIEPRDAGRETDVFRLERVWLLDGEEYWTYAKAG